MSSKVICRHAWFQCLLLYYNEQKVIFSGFLPTSMLFIHSTLVPQNSTD